MTHEHSRDITPRSIVSASPDPMSKRERRHLHRARRAASDAERRLSNGFSLPSLTPDWRIGRARPGSGVAPRGRGVRGKSEREQVFFFTAHASEIEWPIQSMTSVQFNLHDFSKTWNVLTADEQVSSLAPHRRLARAGLAARRRAREMRPAARRQACSCTTMPSLHRHCPPLP